MGPDAVSEEETEAVSEEEAESVSEEEAEAVPQAVLVNPTVAEPEVACLGKPFGVIDLEDEIPQRAEIPKCLVPDSTVAEPAVNAYQPDADVTRALVKLSREIGEQKKLAMARSYCSR